MRVLLRPILAFVVVAACGTEAGAASARLSYGFRPGEVYRVTEQYHDVGTTVTEVNMMGQPQKFETASDQVSSGTWSATGTGREGDSVRLAVKYGQHKGGQRWSSNKVRSEEFLAGSGAEVMIHPMEGLVKIDVMPEGDSTLELIYRGRFAWMPPLPRGFIKKGDTFTHEYVMRSEMYNIKTTDDYRVVEVRGNHAAFDVETRQFMVFRMDRGPGGVPVQDMSMTDMKLAYKGTGTAVFNVKEGIFTEREVKLSYSNLDGSQDAAPDMAFRTRTEGVVSFRWEMERK